MWNIVGEIKYVPEYSNGYNLSQICLESPIIIFSTRKHRKNIFVFIKITTVNISAMKGLNISYQCSKYVQIRNFAGLILGLIQQEISNCTLHFKTDK